MREPHNLAKIFRRVIFHSACIAFIFSIVVFLRYPALLNADYFLSYDEAFMAAAILEFINGGPLFFFYEGVNYHGVIGGMTAIPFMWLLGIGSLAYKLPASLYYSLYIWSTFLIARQIAPRLGLLVVIIMLFPPSPIFSITLLNWPHTEICFIGNMLLLLFIKIKTKDKIECLDIFSLGMVMGFAIYTYTYAVLYVLTILLVFILTHERWESLREKISIKNFIRLFRNLPGKKYILVRILDLVIFLFFISILFSYVFGGFGLDFGGYSILQINKIHKPVFQVIIILMLRLCIRRDDIATLFVDFKQWIGLQKAEVKQYLAFGGFGFIVGLFPRILAIVSGDIKSGGQGFDIDFIPHKLVLHFLSLITQVIPNILGVYQPLKDWGSSLSYEPLIILLGFISLYIFLVILWTLGIVVISQRKNVLAFLKMKQISFNPTLVLIIFSVLTLVSVVISQSGPLPRYLYPLFGVVAICLALVLDKIRETSPKACIVLVLFWVGFYASTAYANYLKVGVVDGLQVVRLEEHSLKPLIKFFQSKNIKTIYTSMFYSSAISFWSGGELVGVEYSRSVRGKKVKALSAHDPDFAILIDEKNIDDIRNFRAIAVKNDIVYQTERIGSFFVFLKFRGNESDIDGLRSFSG